MVVESIQQEALSQTYPEARQWANGEGICLICDVTSKPELIYYSINFGRRLILTGEIDPRTNLFILERENEPSLFVIEVGKSLNVSYKNASREEAHELLQSAIESFPESPFTTKLDNSFKYLNRSS